MNNLTFRDIKNNKECNKKVIKLYKIYNIYYKDIVFIFYLAIDKETRGKGYGTSSTNGFKKVIQNNRVKSERKPGREKGHKRSAPVVCKNPDKVVNVSKVATCACGCKTIETEEVVRDLISIEIIVHTTQYVGKKTKCPCCNKEYEPKFPSNVKSIINFKTASN